MLKIALVFQLLTTIDEKLFQSLTMRMLIILQKLCLKTVILPQ